MWTQLVADAPELKRQAGGSARGRRLENPFGHYILAWHPDEKPSKEHVLESVGSAMQELGYKGCQYRVVAHQDTDHLHAHVIVCRVNPENGRAMGRKKRRHPPPRVVARLREAPGQDPRSGTTRRSDAPTPARSRAAQRPDPDTAQPRGEGTAPGAPPAPEDQRRDQPAHHAHGHRATGVGGRAGRKPLE